MDLHIVQPAASCEDNGVAPKEKTAVQKPKDEKPFKKATRPELVPHPKTRAERAARLRRILNILDELYPRPAVPLHHRNCWELLVATILSAQCTDKRVNETTPMLFEKYPTIEDFASANLEELGNDIRSTGFYNNKAKSLIGAARKILSDFGGNVPKTMNEMLTIPGAARKTANVVLGGCYGIHEGIVVDTHVQRNAQRLDLTKNDQPVKIEQDLIKTIPKEKWFDFPLQLIYHGRALCVARHPLCADCKLDPLCYAKDKSV